MIKRLLGLTIVLGISVSCSKNNKVVVKKSKENIFFKNDTIQNILDEILLENKSVRSLSINFIDEKEQTLLMFKETDSIYSCENFEGVYYHNNIRFFLFNYSKKINLNKIINRKLDLNFCENYLAKFEDIIDTEEYVYEVDIDGKIYYPNGKNIIYNNGKVRLKFWRENK